MSKPKNAKSPWLDCPECGTPVVEAHGRGRHDPDGNIIEHRDACRCAWCDWMWFDDREPVACRCGALVCVGIDDGHAYARDANNPDWMPIPPLPDAGGTAQTRAVAEHVGVIAPLPEGER